MAGSRGVPLTSWENKAGVIGEDLQGLSSNEREVPSKRWIPVPSLK